MTQSSPTRVLWQLTAVILTVVVIGALYLAKTVIFPLALALLLTFILAPLVTMLERLRVPRVTAVLCVILATGAILGSIGWTVFTQLIEVAESFPSYRLNVQTKIESFRKSKTTRFTRAQQELNWISQQISALSAEATGEKQHPAKEALGSSPDRPLAVREVGTSPARLDALDGALGALLTILLVVVFTFFMMLNREELRNRLIRLMGSGNLNVMTQAMDDASRRVSRYLSLQLLVNASFGMIISIALQMMGLPHALLWGFLACLLRFIPYIGAPIAAALPIAMSIAVFDGWSKTLLIMATFFCLEIVTANFVEPHVYGRYTGLSSLAILIAAIFWSLIWGPIGLILSVPLTVCLVVVGSHVPSLDFLTILLGDQPVMPPDAHYYQRLLANDAHEARQVLEAYLEDNSVPHLYDAVLVPALKLAEQDRHQNALDETTVQFIAHTTKELVDELSLRSEMTATGPAAETANGRVPPGLHATDHRRIVCVPARDDADEIVGIMLAQLLERAGLQARAIPIGTVDRMTEETLKSEPDLVCLSALPPYAVSHARNIYRRLRRQNAGLKILIGLWAYTEDAAKAAQEISEGETNQVCINLAQMTLQASLALKVPVEQLPSEVT
ncbi:MAG TPA: AI-2E family transporter [Terracidiphilus sp.]